MTIENFQHLITASDGNGEIDVDQIVAVYFQKSFDTVIQEKIPATVKRKAILPYLKNTFIVYMDKYGNGYSRMIY